MSAVKSLVTALVALTIAAPALAAPPPNDNRADAQLLPTFPAVTHGTASQTEVASPEPSGLDGRLGLSGSVRNVRVAQARRAAADVSVVVSRVAHGGIRNGTVGRERGEREACPQREDEGPMPIPNQSRHESPSIENRLQCT